MRACAAPLLLLLCLGEAARNHTRSAPPQQALYNLDGIIPDEYQCQLVKRSIRRWDNECGVNVPNQMPPGIKDETKDYTSFTSGECGYGCQCQFSPGNCVY